MSEYFGRYRLLERIGGGSLGEVFVAESREDSVVALKRLARQHRDSPVHIAMLARESAISRRMQHARLLGALDFGKVEGWPFLTQPLVQGGTLDARLSPTLPPEELGGFADDLFEALAAVHAFGYAHSDISPSNVLLDHGRLRLTDFSAATQLGCKQAQPNGTYAFMSPEQVKGEPLDARSDVFAAATLLWLCATGERIFSRDAPHLCFMAVVNDEVPAMAPELAPLEKALRPALAKRPAERLSDIKSLSQSVAAALKSLPPRTSGGSV